MDMALSNFEKILTSKKTRYDVLKPLIESVIPDRELVGDTINIFIDVYSVFAQLFNPETLNEFSSMNKKDKNKFSAEVLNLAGHYRNFFATRFERYTSIYLIFPTEPCADKMKLFSMYRKEWYSKRIDTKHPIFGVFAKLLKQNLGVVSMIAPYIPHLYAIDTKEIDHLVIPELIIEKTETQEAFNIIVSNDVFMLSAVSRYPYTCMLTTRSQRSNIHQDDLAMALSDAKKIGEEENQIAKFFFDFILALGGDTKLGLERIAGTTRLKAILFFKDLLNKDNIQLKRYTDPELVANILVKHKKITPEASDIFVRNYKLVSAMDYLKNMSKGKQEIILEQIRDRLDIAGLQTMNSESFYRNPLNFDFLFAGEANDGLN